MADPRFGTTPPSLSIEPQLNENKIESPQDYEKIAREALQNCNNVYQKLELMNQILLSLESYPTLYLEFKIELYLELINTYATLEFCDKNLIKPFYIQSIALTQKIESQEKRDFLFCKIAITLQKMVPVATKIDQDFAKELLCEVHSAFEITSFAQIDGEAAFASCRENKNAIMISTAIKTIYQSLEKIEQATKNSNNNRHKSKLNDKYKRWQAEFKEIMEMSDGEKSIEKAIKLQKELDIELKIPPKIETYSPNTAFVLAKIAIQESDKAIQQKEWKKVSINSERALNLLSKLPPDPFVCEKIALSHFNIALAKSYMIPLAKYEENASFHIASVMKIYEEQKRNPRCPRGILINCHS